MDHLTHVIPGRYLKIATFLHFGHAPKIFLGTMSNFDEIFLPSIGSSRIRLFQHLVQGVDLVSETDQGKISSKFLKPLFEKIFWDVPSPVLWTTWPSKTRIPGKSANFQCMWNKGDDGEESTLTWLPHLWCKEWEDNLNVHVMPQNSCHDFLI